MLKWLLIQNLQFLIGCAHITKDTTVMGATDVLASRGNSRQREIKHVFKYSLFSRL